MIGAVQYFIYQNWIIPHSAVGKVEQIEAGNSQLIEHVLETRE